MIIENPPIFFSLCHFYISCWRSCWHNRGCLRPKQTKFSGPAIPGRYMIHCLLCIPVFFEHAVNCAFQCSLVCANLLEPNNFLTCNLIWSLSVFTLCIEGIYVVDLISENRKQKGRKIRVYGKLITHLPVPTDVAFPSDFSGSSTYSTCWVAA